MGNLESAEGGPGEPPSVSLLPPPGKMPMPEPCELEERFALVLSSMNLPPDKARLLRQYDNEKKWDLICDQERFQVKNPPHTYIQKLQSFLDPSVTRKKFRRRVQESTKVLRELEISLRTNHIGWVREFLNDENKGLDVLVDYLSFAQCSVMYSTLPGRRALKNSRLVSQKDDVHVCILCLRAIMNYQYGFNLVMSHPHAVNEIALSLNNKNPRTKALVLELLAAVCLVRGGHEIILAAFDNFKEVCKELHRFEKLMEYFRNEDSNIDFMKSRHTESEKLQVQIQAYLDNVFDVGGLLEDAETKNVALEKVEELEEHVSHLTEKLLDLENENMMRVAELEKQLLQREKELESIKDLDLDKFEELFKTKAQGPALDLICSKNKTAQKAASKVTLLEANRAKNLAITLRKAGRSAEEICRAIHTFDLQTLPVDFVECLMRFLPTEAEVKLLRQYERERQPLEELAAEDRFMLLFSKVERLTQRMAGMAFLGNFQDNLQMLTPQLNAIIAASASVKSSQKLKQMLEIILALGNYMNSSKRGAVYGFKLQSLDLLLDTKSTDRKMTLLHFIALTVKEKYPDLANFWHELHFVEKAAAVSLENVLLDVKELGRGMELIRRECSIHDNSVLRNFLSTNEGKLDKLQRDAKTAEEAYNAVVRYFGESPKTTPPSVFFPVFVRFIRSYKEAEQENEARKKQEEVMREKQLAQEAKKLDAKTPSQRNKWQQQELIAELRRRQAKEHRPVYEGKDGTIEDIITGLHRQPIVVRHQARSAAPPNGPPRAPGPH
uniref:Formin like 3 n=1 Tax=Panthera leo TaxID=9689 RepID=A0A8C8XH38_PANLE